LSDLAQEFDEAAAEMFGEATPEENPETEAPAEPADDRLRNPAGQFETPEQREERLYAGKYRTPEDLEAAHQSLEQKLGEQGNELGQYRQWYEQFQAAAQQQANTPPAPPQEAITENPAAVVQYALQTQNQALYEEALDEWFDLDPKAASRFDNARMLAHQQWQMEQQLQALQASQQPIQQQYQQIEQVNLARELQQRYPDFEQVMSSPVIETAVQSLPQHVLAPLQGQGTREAWEGALNTLYWVAKGMAGQEPAPVEQQQAPPTPGQPAGVVQRLSAQVASPSSGPAPEVRTLSREQLENQRLLEIFDENAQDWNF
jgi:hypothetical protein